ARPGWLPYFPFPLSPPLPNHGEATQAKSRPGRECDPPASRRPSRSRSSKNTFRLHSLSTFPPIRDRTRTSPHPSCYEVHRTAILSRLTEYWAAGRKAQHVEDAPCSAHSSLVSLAA